MIQRPMALPYERGKQVLKILAEYGPLSRRALHTLLEPGLEDRRLRDCLQRLCERGLLTKKYDRIFQNSHNAALYYQIARNPHARRNVASLIGITPDQLDVPGPKHQALIHWEECALWADQFKRKFPQAKVLRENQFFGDPVIQNILKNKDNPFETNPDLLILHPSPADDDPTAVAVEIEKNRKSSKRIFNKLKKYASATLLDGVIYICDTDAILQSIDVIFKSRVLERSPRYAAEHFEPSLLANARHRKSQCEL